MHERTMWIGQFVLFFGAGVVATLVHYTCMVILASGFGVPAVVAASIGYSAGAVVSYIINYQVTFKSTQSYRSSIFKFLGMAACGFVVNAYAVSYGTDQLGLHYVVAQIVVTGVLLLQNFILSKTWAFKEAK